MASLIVGPGSVAAPGGGGDKARELLEQRPGATEEPVDRRPGCLGGIGGGDGETLSESRRDELVLEAEGGEKGLCWAGLVTNAVVGTDGEVVMIISGGTGEGVGEDVHVSGGYRCSDDVDLFASRGRIDVDSAACIPPYASA